MRDRAVVGSFKQRATWQPFSANVRTIAAPMPGEPPVTTAVRLVSSRFIASLDVREPARARPGQPVAMLVLAPYRERA